jgi:hypothetical protein
MDGASLTMVQASMLSQIELPVAMPPLRKTTRIA